MLAACDVEAPPAGLGLACERTTNLEESAPRHALDVLLVVSDSRGMQDVPVEAGLRDLAHELAVGGLPSVRIGVVGPAGLTTAPRDPSCGPVAGAFLESEELPWFWCEGLPCRATNFGGELADALACVETPALADEPAPVLERALRALESGELVREGTPLLLVLIAPEDDASPRPIGEYATRLRALASDEAQTFVATISPPALPRLDAFRAAFPDHALEARLDGPWGDAAQVADRWSAVPSPCVYGALDDVDPMPGVQPACVAAEGADGSGPVIPPCLMLEAERPDPATPLACYWIRAERDPSCGAEAVVERAEPSAWRQPPPPARLRCPCEHASDVPDVIEP